MASWIQVTRDGIAGLDGIAGQDGIAGWDGIEGQDEIAGQDGIAGWDGIEGQDEIAGQDGIAGWDGIEGQDGIGSHPICILADSLPVARAQELRMLTVPLCEHIRRRSRRWLPVQSRTI